MIDDPKIYGVIIEHKCEQPLIMEGAPMTHDKASERMRFLCARPDIIRAAIFKISHVCGNETLIEKESE